MAIRLATISIMKLARAVVLIVATALVAVASVALHSGRMPTGVRGEWEWPRVPFAPSPWDVGLALLAVLAYSAFAGLGLRAMGDDRGGSRRIARAGWLAVLVPAAMLAQAGTMAGAPTGYGMTKWVTLAIPGSSGYFEVARARMADPWAFWRAYPTWIRDQDALHVGTHPPGLFLLSRGLMALTEARPGVVARVEAGMPRSVKDGFTTLVPPMPRSQRAAIALMAAMTMGACCATVLPIYALARARLSARASWASACLWPLAPSAVLFAPAADTAFPFLATTALALAAYGGPRNAALAGLALGVGMQFTLAFLPVGLAAGIVLATGSGTPSRRAGAILWTGAGFLAITGLAWAASGGANPWAIWISNARNHARFYQQYPKSYSAWSVVNPIEAAMAIGLAGAAWAMVGASRSPRSFWAVVVVLILLDLSGRNLSEVARLWLPFYPTLLVAAGAGMARLEAGGATLAGTVALVGMQTLALEATIQVVYPF